MPLTLVNARVLTMDPGRPHAGSVTVGGDRILALDAPPAAGDPVLDCGGGLLLPGLIDPHVHLLAAAAALCAVDCSPRAVRSIAEIQARLADAAAASPDGWLRAAGYDEFSLTEGRHPTRWDLDAAVPHRPVRLRHRSGHADVLNSAALAAAGITIESEEPPGGVIDRRLDDGEPSGLLIDMEALIERAMPPLPFADLVRGMRLLDQRLSIAGVTAVQDLTHRNDAARLDLLSRVCTAAGFRPRRLPPATRPGVPGDGPVKLMLPEAAGLTPERDAALRGHVIEAHRAGRQVAVHAATAESVRWALDAIAAALEAAPRADHRHRIEHAALCPPPLAARAASLGVIVVANPALLLDGGPRYRATIAAADLPHLHAAGALARAGVLTALSADPPVSWAGPLESIAAAVERRDRDGAPVPGVGAGWDAAAAMVTRNAAVAARAEREVGSIAPGRFADLVLLDRLPAPGAAAAVRWRMIGGVSAPP